MIINHGANWLIFMDSRNIKIYRAACFTPTEGGIDQCRAVMLVPQSVLPVYLAAIALRKSPSVTTLGPCKAVICYTSKFNFWMFSYKFTEYGFAVVGVGVLAAGGGGCNHE
ncbi:MAG: hypothetical protein PHC94_06560 [Methylobacter sp.]|jgi:hypothetical protein|nr:hypothetical protein [Methylococcales bacterium]MDD5113660.1 hypothetical protein [Methylobacter sp.]